jgi:hypothetical protein
MSARKNPENQAMIWGTPGSYDIWVDNALMLKKLEIDYD